jgi:hypothetical protein
MAEQDLYHSGDKLAISDPARRLRDKLIGVKHDFKDRIQW